MKNKMIYIAFAFFVAQPSFALDENQLIEKIQALDWKTEPGEYELVNKKSSVTTTSEEYLLSLIHI